LIDPDVGAKRSPDSYHFTLRADAHLFPFKIHHVYLILRLECVQKLSYMTWERGLYSQVREGNQTTDVTRFWKYFFSYQTSCSVI